MLVLYRKKPRWVLVGLQTDKSGRQVRNAAIFDHCNLTNLQVWLNHSRYPSLDMITDFAKEQFAGVYKSLYDFASRYNGIDNLLTGSGVSSSTFKSLYPIHGFDISKQSERLTGVVDLTLRMDSSVTICNLIEKCISSAGKIQLLGYEISHNENQTISRFQPLRDLLPPHCRKKLLPALHTILNRFRTSLERSSLSPVILCFLS